MRTNTLWVLPINSVEINKLLFMTYNGQIILAFDYFNEDKEQYDYCYITFSVELAFRNSSEKFTHFIQGTYDTLVEVVDSDWIEELKNIEEESVDFWNPKHFAIYIKDHGLFEIIATDFRVVEPRKGILSRRYHGL